jgi:MFS family permease
MQLDLDKLHFQLPKQNSCIIYKQQMGSFSIVPTIPIIDSISNRLTLVEMATSHPDFQIPPLSLPREVIMMFTVCSAQGLVQASLAQSFIPNLLIGETFKAQPSDTAWYPAAYGLTSGTFMLAFGRVGDMIGHKELFVGAWSWSFLWALLAGISVYSDSQVFFDICRAFQGMGAAALVPSALAILGSIYKPGPRKNLAFSLYASGAPIGFTLGAVFAGLLAQLASWPWAFYINAIVCLIYAGLALVFVPALGKRPNSKQESFDYLGTFTIVSGKRYCLGFLMVAVLTFLFFVKGLSFLTLPGIGLQKLAGKARSVFHL